MAKKKHHEHHKSHHKMEHHGKLDQEKEKGGGGGSLTAGTGKKGAENHTGEITHGIAHVMSVGGKDKHASKEYHKHNAHHGMHDGFSPEDESNEGPSDPEGNEECC